MADLDNLLPDCLDLFVSQEVYNTYKTFLLVKSKCTQIGNFKLCENLLATYCSNMSVVGMCMLCDYCSFL